MTTTDEIDLRDCIRVLVRRRYWIVACVLVVAVLTLAVSLILPKGYHAPDR